MCSAWICTENIHECFHMTKGWRNVDLGQTPFEGLVALQRGWSAFFQAEDPLWSPLRRATCATRTLRQSLLWNKAAGSVFQWSKPLDKNCKLTMACRQGCPHVQNLWYFYCLGVRLFSIPAAVWWLCSIWWKIAFSTPKNKFYKTLSTVEFYSDRVAGKIKSKIFMVGEVYSVRKGNNSLHN